jgi:F0F1-type ATP synthase membrane subunit c/vacuolar-type H+-ATPase subunit K
MSPEAKKVVSGLLVAIAAAVIGVLQAYVVQLPPEYVAVVAPVLVGLAHYVNALGHAERVEKAANAKAADVLTAVIDREQVH